MKAPLRILALSVLACGTLSLHATLNVVATLPDLGALAEIIGGNEVKVTSLARGIEDPHFVDPKPSFIRLLNRADVLIEGGAELELGWLPPLVNNARNPKILGNASGHILAAQGVRLIQVPAGSVDRSQGDVHRLGNPHYLLDPGNCKTVAAHIAEVFARLDPAKAALYDANLRQFEAQLEQKLAGWTQRLSPFRGAQVVTYHKSFDYFLNYFGLRLAGTIEPKPGVEPSPAHISDLIPQAKAAGVKLVIIEPNRPRKTPAKVAQTIGAKLLVLPLMVGGNEEARDFFSWFDYNVEQIALALQP